MRTEPFRRLSYQADLARDRDGLVLNGPDYEILRSMGWGATLYAMRVPESASTLVQSYLDAGHGPDAIGSKLPFLWWLLFMGHFTSEELLLKFVASTTGLMALRETLGDAWCRQILLDRMAPLSKESEESDGPSVEMKLLDGSVGIDTSDFVGECIASVFAAGRIRPQEFDETGRVSLLDFLANGNTFGNDVMRGTLKVLLLNWGRTYFDRRELGDFARPADWRGSGTVNRQFADLLFQAMALGRAWELK